MPLLNFLQTITPRLPHKQKHHDGAEHATKGKEVISTKRRLGYEHRGDERHDVISKLSAH